MKHIPHIEDRIFEGKAGFDYLLKVMFDLHNGMLGKKKVIVSEKMDGAPAIVFGIHPDTRKFFLSTKSAWNKTPILCYSAEEIPFFFGGKSEDLIQKLMVAFKFIQPLVKEGVYQGDIMALAKHIDLGQSISFGLNTVKYTLDDEFAQSALFCEIAVCVHTQYRGDTWITLTPEFEVEWANFRESEDVWWIKPQRDLREIVYHHVDQKKILDCLAVAKEDVDLVTIWGQFPWETTKAWQEMCIKHVNACVKKGKEPAFAADRPEIPEAIWHAFNKVQEAKNRIINILDKQTKFKHSINGEPCGPEGYVVAVDGKPSKLIHRYTFSRINQLQGRFRNDPQEPVHI
jgi:hypothetical protein